MQNQNINSLLWEHVENQNTKIAKRVYNVLNKDIFSLEIIDNQSPKVFFFQTTCSSFTIPNFVYDYVKKWATKQGYTYLYDLPCNH